MRREGEDREEECASTPFISNDRNLLKGISDQKNGQTPFPSSHPNWLPFPSRSNAYVTRREHWQENTGMEKRREEKRGEKVRCRERVGKGAGIRGGIGYGM